MKALYRIRLVFGQEEATVNEAVSIRPRELHAISAR